MNNILFTKETSQHIDLDINVKPNQYLVVNGYANKFTVKIKIREELKNNILIDEIKKSNILYGKKYAFCGDSFTSGGFSGLTDSEGRTGKDSPEYWDNER